MQCAVCGAVMQCVVPCAVLHTVHCAECRMQCAMRSVEGRVQCGAMQGVCRRDNADFFMY